MNRIENFVMNARDRFEYARKYADQSYDRSVAYAESRDFLARIADGSNLPPDQFSRSYADALAFVESMTPQVEQSIARDLRTQKLYKIEKSLYGFEEFERGIAMAVKSNSLNDLDLSTVFVTAVYSPEQERLMSNSIRVFSLNSRGLVTETLHGMYLPWDQEMGQYNVQNSNGFLLCVAAEEGNQTSGGVLLEHDKDRTRVNLTLGDIATKTFHNIGIADDGERDIYFHRNKHFRGAKRQLPNDSEAASSFLESLFPSPLPQGI